MNQKAINRSCESATLNKFVDIRYQQPLNRNHKEDACASSFLSWFFLDATYIQTDTMRISTEACIALQFRR